MIYDINNNHSYHYYEIAKKKNQKKHKISICKQIFPFFCDASTRQELQVALQREFTDKRLTINVKKTKLMLVGSKRMLSSFEDFELQPNGTHIVRMQSFK